MNQLLHTSDSTLPKIRPDRFRQFLFEWGNAGQDDIFRLARRFPEFHPPAFETSRGLQRLSVPDNWRVDFQAAWRERNPEWRGMLLAELMARVMGTAATHQDEAGTPAAWAQNVAGALVAAIKIFDRFAVCSNPECLAPLFIRNRKNQAQCSPECAAWAQRKWKKDWWKEHGPKWRAKRKRAETDKRNGKKPQRKGGK